MTAIHASLNAYLKYLDSPEGRAQSTLNREQLAAFNKAVHNYAVTRRNSQGNNTMMKRFGSLFGQARAGTTNFGPNTGRSPANMAKRENAAIKIQQRWRAGKSRNAMRQTTNAAIAKKAENAALAAARAGYQQQNVLKKAIAKKRQNLISNANKARENARKQANAARQGKVNEVTARAKAIKRIQAKNFKIMEELQALNNRANKTVQMERENVKKALRRYVNSTFVVVNNKSGQQRVIPVSAATNGAVYRALMNKYNISQKRGSGIGRAFRRTFGGPSTRASQAKQNATRFFTSAPRLGGIGARLKYGTMGQRGITMI